MCKCGGVGGVEGPSTQISSTEPKLENEVRTWNLVVLSILALKLLGFPTLHATSSSSSGRACLREHLQHGSSKNGWLQNRPHVQ